MISLELETLSGIFLISLLMIVCDSAGVRACCFKQIIGIAVTPYNSDQKIGVIFRVTCA
jgi:hypothetical protein